MDWYNNHMYYSKQSIKINNCMLEVKLFFQVNIHNYNRK